MSGAQEISAAPAVALPATALVVEDNAMLREVIVSLLETCGLQATATGDGLEARELLRRDDYGVVICDLDLPGMSGDQLLALCRAERPEVAARFIFITGGWHLRDESFLPDLGQPFLLKPFTCARLVELVKSTVGRG
jgi:CheY-like chemotaxis protein